MRRIYESAAVDRDDSDPFKPGESPDRYRPQSMRLVNSSWLSRQLLPQRLVRRGVHLEVTTPRDRYPVGMSVPFAVTFKNTFPFPVTLRTESPVGWSWAVDGHTEASPGVNESVPAGTWAFRLDRGERRQILREWHGRLKIAETKWAYPDPGEHVISAQLDLPGENSRLVAETAIELVAS